MKGKILICGDSFASEWPAQGFNVGWPVLLKTKFCTVNRAHPGIGEYKILQQLTKENLNNYTAIIVCHTSPNRVHIKQHPVHQGLYRNADLIYNDVVEHATQYPTNSTLQAAKNYFELIYDQNYYNDIYLLLQQKIVQLTNNYNCLHLTPLFDTNNSIFTHCLNLYKMCSIEPGSTNHYSIKDNTTVLCEVTTWLESNA